jgi:predicted RNA-binding protein YlxR (DUF448 family)/ribosomal protein L30E
MTRGGRVRDHDSPERRCLVTGESGPVGGLIRFVLGPDGMVVPDLGERLPGRGAWVTADASALAQVVRKNLFSRAFKAQAKVPPDLPSQIEQGLARRLVDAIAMARKAGLVTMGFDAVKARLKAGSVAALIEAADGAEGGKGKLRPLAGDAVLIDTPTAAELGLAFGREFVIHAVLDSGGAAERAVREHRRLSGFRSAQDIRAA